MELVYSFYERLTYMLLPHHGHRVRVGHLFSRTIDNRYGLDALGCILIFKRNLFEQFWLYRAVDQNSII